MSKKNEGKPALSKTRMSVLSRLGNRKMRLKHNLFLIEGVKSVRDIASSDKFAKYVVSFIITPERTDEATELSKKFISKGLPSPEILTADPADMRKISSLSSAPDMIAVCRLPERRTPEELTGSRLPDGLYLMLDGIQDPGNLGTIIRTAHWFGVKRIFASPSTADIFNPKTIQASMGSLASVEIDYVDLDSIIVENPHIPVVGLLLDGSDIFSTRLPSSAFILMGNEGNGISNELRERITLPLTIPPYDTSDHSESLNVAIATAITLAEFRKK